VDIPSDRTTGGVLFGTAEGVERRRQHGHHGRWSWESERTGIVNGSILYAALVVLVIVVILILVGVL
jgi:hypothetical protein